jgi:hypothetical protein
MHAYAAGMRRTPLGTGAGYAGGYAGSLTLRSRGGPCIPPATDVPRATPQSLVVGGPR